MAAPSRETLQTIAGATGHQPATLEKVVRLIDLIQEVSDDATLKGKFALKGGTALNVFILGLDRLSVDIDLNYVGALDREAMTNERGDLEVALQRILASQNYQIDRKPEQHGGGKWIARYSSALGGAGTLEVDINYMMREPLFGVHAMNSIKLGDYQAQDVPVVDQHEIIAGKLVALLSRQAARDLFDATRIFAMDGLDWRAIRAAMHAIGATGKKDWRKASVDTIKVTKAEFGNNLLSCLPRAHLEQFGGQKAWTGDAIELCKERLAPILDFTAGERAFLDGVIEKGEIDASGLDADDDLRARIERMPMLKWRAGNVAKA